MTGAHELGALFPLKTEIRLARSQIINAASAAWR